VLLLPNPPAPALAEREPPPARGSRVLPPLVVYVGAGLTLISGGLTVWSGLDTLHARDRYRAGDLSLEEGQARQSRTNALFWTSIGLAVSSAVLAIAFVDWHRGPRQVRVGLGGLGALEIEGAL
jgi:hypothetical protein